MVHRSCLGFRMQSARLGSPGFTLLPILCQSRVATAVVTPYCLGPPVMKTKTPDIALHLVLPPFAPVATVSSGNDSHVASTSPCWAH